MVEWPENDFRIFVGDMGPEVTDDVLVKAFEHYASFTMGRMVKDKRTNKNKGPHVPLHLGLCRLSACSRVLLMVSASPAGQVPCPCNQCACSVRPLC